ncbi:MAG: class B sortase [Clostridiales bacterium]|nr:class B sortase [Clostridiales bacterium]
MSTVLIAVLVVTSLNLPFSAVPSEAAYTRSETDIIYRIWDQDLESVIWYTAQYGTDLYDTGYEFDSWSSLLIYGHHMRNGRMFAALQNYTLVSYYQQHPYIQFDTLTEAGSYEIVMVLRLDAEGNQVPWQKVLFPANKKEFQEAWEIAAQKKFFDTGVEVSFGDELLALVTCEYTQANGRLMVIARRIP